MLEGSSSVDVGTIAEPGKIFMSLCVIISCAIVFLVCVASCLVVDHRRILHTSTPPAQHYLDL